MENVSQQIYTNNPNGTIHVDIAQTWDTGTNAWKNDSRNTYTYAACNILPLTLLQFNAVNKNSDALLTWQTTNELNTDYFTVQKSLNGTTFENIGKVNAKGNSSAVNNYSYADNIANIKSGAVYYRLKMVDKDGKSVASKVAVITISKNDFLFVVKPNPAHNFLIVSTGEPNSVVSIASLSGQVVLKQTIGTGSEHTLNISSLAKGTYIVTMRTKNGVSNKKLIIE